MPRTHTCQALFCEAEVPRDKLMCKSHWYTVPQAIRRRVNATWREVKWWRRADKEKYREAVTAYRAAVGEAVEAVAKAEGAPS